MEAQARSEPVLKCDNRSHLIFSTWESSKGAIAMAMTCSDRTRDRITEKQIKYAQNFTAVSGKTRYTSLATPSRLAFLGGIDGYLVGWGVEGVSKKRLSDAMSSSEHAVTVPKKESSMACR